MGKLEANKKRKKEALYNTAFELFTTKGLAKTTISDIVAKAGVAKGTFYLYFQDKYDIRNKLISHKTCELFFQAHEVLKKQSCTLSRNSSILLLIIYWTFYLKTALCFFLLLKIWHGAYLRELLKKKCQMKIITFTILICSFFLKAA